MQFVTLHELKVKSLLSDLHVMCFLRLMLTQQTLKNDYKQVHQYAIINYLLMSVGLKLFTKMVGDLFGRAIKIG